MRAASDASFVPTVKDEIDLTVDSDGEDAEDQRTRSSIAAAARPSQVVLAFACSARRALHAPSILGAGCLLPWKPVRTALSGVCARTGCRPTRAGQQAAGAPGSDEWAPATHTRAKQIVDLTGDPDGEDAEQQHARSSCSAAAGSSQVSLALARGAAGR